MSSLLAWGQQNIPWIFSGVGVAAILLVGGLIFRKKNGTLQSSTPSSQNTNTNTSTITVNVSRDGNPRTRAGEDPLKNQPDLDTRKRLTNILFIDDQTEFKVVSILKQSGWKNTKIKKDLRSLDDPDLVEAHICFIDIQGVGKALGFKDEGLGLAEAIMSKYPSKKVVIYSSQNEGDRFHEALRKAHAVLRKDADPYEFQNHVEVFSQDIGF